ncbi:hypothetical protein AS850_11055 [Frondihabitans sp. 762G35]|uniref:nucleotidyltransferase domain-containing protein n=1 Tax=Frondihabitans sp. 762G35 TaxID=1446794 RepID=UPI000D22BBDD|nr:nucleotidyltransferase domain-containing protein [Frondihabitans sp. 762G35]ARC57609.1 hypothetical protein AS850_11055 [Frondihabitans sp. 762G35]
MDLASLLSQSAVSEDVRAAAAELVAKKAITREMGTGSPPDILRRFVETELDCAEHFETDRPERPVAEVREKADLYFQTAITRFGHPGADA